MPPLPLPLFDIVDLNETAAGGRGGRVAMILSSRDLRVIPAQAGIQYGVRAAEAEDQEEEAGSPPPRG